MSNFAFINQANASSKNKKPSFGDLKTGQRFPFSNHPGHHIDFTNQELGITPPGDAVNGVPVLSNFKEFGSLDKKNSSSAFDKMDRKLPSFEPLSQSDFLFARPKPKHKKPIRFSSSFIVEDMVQEAPHSDIQPKPSAFSFMHEKTSPTLSTETVFGGASNADVFTFESPSLSKSVIKPDNEVKLIKANANWQQIKKAKSQSIDNLKHLYDKHKQIKDTMKKLEEKIKTTELDKEKALEAEDYLAAQKLSLQKKEMVNTMTDLQENKLNAIYESIQKTWKLQSNVWYQEAECIEQFVTYHQQAKEERFRHYNTFVEDMKRKHHESISRMEERRSSLEQAKSAIVFDLDMWNQSDADLNERMEDVVHLEKEKKTKLEQKSKGLADEIDQLRQRLRELESQNQSIQHQVQGLESEITTKLKPFEQEVKEHEQELESIHKRQEETNEKAEMLDTEEESLRNDMAHHKEEQDRHQHDLQSLQDNIEAAKIAQQDAQKANTQLNIILSDVLEKRIKANTQHQQQIKRVSKTIFQKKNSIKEIQSRIYMHEQACIQIEESINRLTSHLGSLEKRKQLAIQNGEFEMAADMSNQIKNTKSTLTSLKEKKDTRDDLEADKQRLDQEKKALISLQDDLITLETTSSRLACKSSIFNDLNL
ncbi:uncharacterized protein B0P05DRAFT_521010 [Gilbertella persicaria]|uniref:uncharacterized protein n=1 Tax=Gilbertella persicaria TaxID=101096 RepID=UPI00221EA21D|nr:uncharacterized protein B0P05DRAFT_521010 [Gilbertella persicaria]KAI8098231.1 hypothetical protein B0P05DRAFT_521010 [Gilbertella persicaria]